MKEYVNEFSIIVRTFKKSPLSIIYRKIYFYHLTNLLRHICRNFGYVNARVERGQKVEQSSVLVGVFNATRLCCPWCSLMTLGIWTLKKPTEIIPLHHFKSIVALHCTACAQECKKRECCSRIGVSIILTPVLLDHLAIVIHWELLGHALIFRQTSLNSYKFRLRS